MQRLANATARAPEKAPFEQEGRAREDEALALICYLVASLHGTKPARLQSKPWGDPALSLARSFAIALARDVLFIRLDRLTEHFGCADNEEVAAHLNLMALRAERDPDVATSFQFARSAAARILGLP
jgi:hypothetical protein